MNVKLKNNKDENKHKNIVKFQKQSQSIKIK